MGITRTGILSTRYTVCTSSSHPSTPSVGDCIYETDTGLVFYYQGATDTWTKDWGVAWGYVASFVTTTDQSGIGSQVDVTGSSLTWTAVANRRYKVSYVVSVAHSTSPGGAVELGVYDGSNNLKGGDLVGVEAGGANSVFVLAYSYLESPAGGSVTRKLRINASGTGGVIDGSSHPGLFLIEDDGPNGAPS